MKKYLLILMVLAATLILVACDISVIPPTLPDEPIDPTENTIESFERLFNDEVAKTITVKITKKEWDALDQSMLDYAEKYNGDLRNNVYVRADMVFSDDQGEIVVEDVGFRTRGNLSRVRIQNDDGTLNMSHFKISFQENFGIQADHRKRHVFELSEIDLKWNRNGDPTYLNEKFSFEMFNAFNIMSQRTTLAKFYIELDDTTHFYGLYTIFEPIDQYFLTRRLDEEARQGDLYRALWQQQGPATLSYPLPANAVGVRSIANNYRPSYDLKTNRQGNEHQTLLSFVENINAYQGEQFRTFIREHMEVEDFLRFLAVGVVLGNPDDYRAMGNNYFLYHNPKTNKWSMIPYDYDHGLGQGWYESSVYPYYSVGSDIYTWFNLANHINPGHNYIHPLVDKILSIPEYQLFYEAFLEELVTNELLFSYSHFYPIYEQQKNLYDLDLEDAMFPLRFGLRNIEYYITQKQSDVLNQLAYYQKNPDQRGA